MNKMSLQKMIGARIRARRERLSLTQPDVADRLNMTAGNYSRIESGSVALNATDIGIVAQVLGVDVAWLYGDDDGLSEDERDVLSYFRKTRPELRHAAIALIEVMSNQSVDGSSGNET